MHLLLTSCSATKRLDAGLLPAIDRYQGPTYRVIKANRPEHLAVWMVSAQFGLLNEHSLIPHYDLRLTKARAEAMQAQVSADLDQLLCSAQVETMFVNLGKVYGLTVQTSKELDRLRHDGRLTEASGGLGLRLQQTKAWLQAIEQAQ